MRSTGWAWRAVTTIALAPLLLVGGCADDRPTDATTTATTVEATPTPSPTADLTRLPEKPAAMSEPTPEGAIAAATYMLALYTYGFVTGDTQPWRSYAASTCEFCNGVVEGIEEMTTAGDSSTGGPFTVLEAEATEFSEDEWFSADLVASQEPSRRVDGDGTTVAENPGGRFRVVFALSWDDGWRVDEMGFERVDDAEVAAE